MTKQYIELTQLTKEMYDITKRMERASKEIFQLAKDKANTEREYRMALAKEMTRLRSEGVPATLIGDLARGAVADLKHKRDMALEIHRSALASLEVIRAQANVLQTISKYQDEV